MISKTTQRAFCALLFGALALNSTPAYASLFGNKKNKPKTVFNLESLSKESAQYTETKNNITVCAKELKKRKRLRNIGKFKQIQVTIHNSNTRSQQLTLDNIDLDLVCYQDIVDRVKSRRLWRSLGVGLLIGGGAALFAGLIGGGIALLTTLGGHGCEMIFINPAGWAVGALWFVVAPTLFLSVTPTAALMHHSSMKTEDDRDIEYVFSEEVMVESNTNTSVLFFVKKRNLKKNFDLTLIDRLGNKTTFNVAL